MNRQQISTSYYAAHFRSCNTHQPLHTSLLETLPRPTHHLISNNKSTRFITIHEPTMPATCVVVGCSSQHDVKNEITFHCLPDPATEHGRQWLLLVNNPNYNEQTQKCVCSFRFVFFVDFEPKLRALRGEPS